MIDPSADLRLMTRAARLYHEEGLTQSQVAHRLGLTQVAVSRLLKKAQARGIVRTTVVTPPGAFAELESALEAKFGLRQAVIGEAARDAEAAVLGAIGAAGAHFLEATLRSGQLLGIPAWSASLLALVERMQPLRRVQHCLVVPLLGGLGDPAAEPHANRLAPRLARLVHGQARFLPVPGLVGSAGAARALAQEPAVREPMGLWGRLDLALVGVGALERPCRFGGRIGGPAGGGGGGRALFALL
jgi:DNA-binding transcriptional regulator LsrR (DeoR family)